jgi:hypothetical protein
VSIESEPIESNPIEPDRVESRVIEPEAALATTDLTLSFGDRQVLRDISLDLREGLVTAL